MNFVTSISLVVLGAMFLALLGWGSIRAAWRNCEGRRGVFAALAILAAICSIVAQKPSPDTPTITVDALLRDVGCYATNNVFHAAVTNAPSYAGVDFSDCDLMVYARERGSTDAASWFELKPRKKFSQQPADYAIENATNFNYMVYLNYVPPSPVHTNGVFELYGFVIENEAQGELDQLAAGFINSRAATIRDVPYDAEVEYLESTGTQYIKTGFTMTDTTSYKGRIMPTGLKYNSGLFGYRFVNSATAYGNMRFFFIYNDGRIGLRNGLDVQNSTKKVVVGSLYNIEVDNQSVRLNDSVWINADNKKEAMTPPGEVWLFFVNCTGYYNIDVQHPVSMRLYSWQIFDNDIIVRDFIPVRVGTTGAMYDKRGVGGMNPDGSPRNDGMYFNRGTGNFGYGNDK